MGACAILDGAYEATLAAAAVLARQRKSRVKVFLTSVGGGAFGNRSMWISSAIERALTIFADAPLDVKLVHKGTLPKSGMMGLEKGRSAPKVSKAAAAASA